MLQKNGDAGHGAFDTPRFLDATTCCEDYMVLCHAWLPPRDQVNAPVHWLGRLQHRPSEVAMGRCSRTTLTVSQHLSAQRVHGAHASTACSFLRLRIITGRRHQIRLHLAHIGGPVVGDRKYTGLPSQVADAQWCGEHCLHRCSLTFFTASFGNSSTAPAKQVRTFEEMPARLKRVISHLRVVKDFRAEHGLMWRKKGRSYAGCTPNNDIRKCKNYRND